MSSLFQTCLLWLRNNASVPRLAVLSCALLAATCQFPFASEDDGDPSCHWDCFGGVTCINGELVEEQYGPAPCDSMCQFWSVGTCEAGCRGRTLNDGFHQPPQVLCADAPGKQPGDPCNASLDCMPVDATVQNDGTVINDYLRCDTDTNTCVAAIAPRNDTWLTACGDEILPYVGTGESGYFLQVSYTCPVCIFFDDSANTCFRSACSNACYGDQDCQPGAVCRDNLRQYGYYDDLSLRVCVPGPPGNVSLVPCSP